jgi:hypothetical protein
VHRLETLFQLVSAVRALPDLTKRRQVAAYEVHGPTTIYVRASFSQVTVRRSLEPRVQIECELRQAFGWEWTVERDEVGIYVVLKRRPVVGKLSTADLHLLVPTDAYLVFHLTPGSVQLADFNGRLAVEPLGNGTPAKPAAEMVTQQSG